MSAFQLSHVRYKQVLLWQRHLNWCIRVKYNGSCVGLNSGCIKLQFFYPSERLAHYVDHIAGTVFLVWSPNFAQNFAYFRHLVVNMEHDNKIKYTMVMAARKKSKVQFGSTKGVRFGFFRWSTKPPSFSELNQTSCFFALPLLLYF